ncbi:hypothetical protein ABW636_18290 [Aquimarina sp. 2201CG1-2-11]|uniref:tetratricopeptide repeat protein n=1 Tax=Aquimarina discodermiae TaxID=3231043 RepID=UPI0034622733
MSTNAEKYYNQIDAYLRGALTNEEKAVFEKLLQENTGLRKELSLHKELYAQFDDTDWVGHQFEGKNIDFKNAEAYFRSEEANAFKEVIEKAEENYKNKSQTRFLSTKKIIVLLAAASVALLFVFTTLLSKDTTEELYSQYNDWQDLPSLTSRGNTNTNSLSKGQVLFEEGNYQQANTIFESIVTTEKELPINVLIYAGATALELKNYTEAIGYFDKIIASNAIDHSKGYWYKAMVYLKQGKKEKVIETLEIITQLQNNYKYKEAIELLNKL